VSAVALTLGGRDEEQQRMCQGGSAAHAWKRSVRASGVIVDATTAVNFLTAARGAAHFSATPSCATERALLS